MVKLGSRLDAEARLGAKGELSSAESMDNQRPNLDARAFERAKLNSREGRRSRGTISLGLLLTNEWLDGNHITSAKAQDANLNISEELYSTILETIVKIWSAINITRLEQVQVKLLKDGLAKLHLWGRDFMNGRLAHVLSQSDELRDTVLQILRRLGQLVCNGKFKDSSNALVADVWEDLVCCEAIELDKAESKALGRQTSSLRRLIERSMLIKSETDEEHDTDKLPGSGLSLSNSTSKNFEGERQSRDMGSSLEPALSEAETSDEEEIQSSASSEGADVFELAYEQVECLMELVPTLEESLASIELLAEKAAHPNRPHFSVSGPAQTWVQSILDKFAEASVDLVERLGEANWQRFVAIRARMAQVSQIATKDQEESYATKLGDVKAVFAEVPQSIFTPHSLFHDSGLGSSVHLTPSLASHTSFMSSIADSEVSALRAPPTPAEVSQGKPFRCEICGHVLFNIRNRLDWKVHIFGDLQPYICTFPSCNQSLVKFSTRSQWADHEFNEHRVDRSWRCPECGEKTNSAQDMDCHLCDCHGKIISPAQIRETVAAAEIKTAWPIEKQECPLCTQIPGRSRRHFVTHVARHLENIALAVLPRETDEELEGSDASSIRSVEQGSAAASDGEVHGNDENAIVDGRRAGQCPLSGCGLYFKDLKAHMLTHQAERPEKCPIVSCEYHTKGFARKYDQAKHTLTHFKGTLTCPFCPSIHWCPEVSFPRVDTLKRHLTSLHGVQQTSSTSRQRSQGGTHLSFPGDPNTAHVGSCSTCSLIFVNPQAFYDHLDGCIFKTLTDVEPTTTEAVKPQSQARKPAHDIKRAQERDESKVNQQRRFPSTDGVPSPSVKDIFPSESSPTLLPSGWFAATSNGDTYYYNIHGEPTWTRPTEAVFEVPQSVPQVRYLNRSIDSAACHQMDWTSYSEEKRRGIYGETVCRSSS